MGAILSCGFSSLANQNVAEMSADRLRELLSGKSPAKFTSSHVQKLSDLVFETIDRLEPLDPVKRGIWEEHIEVIRSEVKKLHDKVLTLDVDMTMMTCFAHLLVERENFRYVTQLDEAYTELVTALGDDGLFTRLDQFQAQCMLLREMAIVINIAILEEMPDPKELHLEEDGKDILGVQLYEFLRPAPPVVNDYLVEVEPSWEAGQPREIGPSQLNFDLILGDREVQGASERALEIASKVERVLSIWKMEIVRKPKNARKYRRFIINGDYLLKEIRLRFPDQGLTKLSARKIKKDKDLGRAFILSYSKAMENLAFRLHTLTSRALNLPVEPAGDA